MDIKALVMILNIIQLDKEHFFDKNSQLREKSVPVEDFGVEFQNQVDNLIDTFNSWKIAVGLSAPQVGIKKRVAVVNLNKDDEPLIIVNPIVINLSGKKDTKKESCLSLPQVRGNVTRRYKLSLQFQDRFGVKNTVEIEGFLARIILHEIDHLDGILYIDRMELNPDLEEFNVPWE